MNTFEITIERKLENSWPVTVRHQPDISSMALWSRGEFGIDPIELNAFLPTDKEYGLRLGKALFRDEIRDSLVRAISEAKTNNASLRVLLIVEADDLRGLHWEQLCAPFDRGWDYLLLNQQTPFSLYLPSQIERRFAPIGRRDLRALVLVAGSEELGSDYELAAFDVPNTVRSIQQALGDIPCDVLASVEGAAGKPTLDNLCEQITAHSPTLLHIVCHGKYIEKKGDTVLYFPIGEKDLPVTATELIKRLGRLDRLPHFTFLSTCESATPGAESGLGGLGQRLVRDLGMPAVLAMTDRIAIDTAEKLASTFYTRLREHGEVDRALSEACAGLQGKYDVTVPALFSRLGGQPLFTDTLNRPLTVKEIDFGLTKLKDLVEQRAPILKPELGLQIASLQSTLKIDPSALSADTKAEQVASLEAINRACIEVCDLSFNALALGQEPPDYDARCPFRGLYPFRGEDREFFFGREALIEKLKSRLAEHPFLAVLGPSGSGKSSLVLAGLIPTLGVKTAYFTPGDDPLAQFESALNSTETVIVVDQFEELFTLTADESKRKAFIERLLALTGKQRIVVTMRADFWGEVAPYPSLKDEMQAHQELVAPMDAFELRAAMEQQAASVGLRFEADLSQTILDDVRGEPGAMPLLQHALLMLWNRRHGRWLRAEEYRAIGGVQQAIAHAADEVYAGLSNEERERVRDIFLRLTRLDNTIASDEQRDTRRRVEQRELVPVNSNPETVTALLKRLADARLIVTSVNSATGVEEVEVAHEALIRYWPRLRGWLEEDRTSLRLREGIREAALEWESANRDESLLVHRGGRLEDAVQLNEESRYSLNEIEQGYVTACVSLQERERAARELRRKRTIIASLAVSVVLLVLAVFGFIQAAKANREATLARAGELATQALYYFDKRLDVSMLLSLEAFHRSDNLQTRNSLFVTLSTPYLDHFLAGHSDAVRGLAFSPDGKTLVSGGNDNTIILWDISDRALPRKMSTLEGHSNWITSLVFSPDGNILASGSNDDSIILWDVSNPTTPRQITTLTGHSAPVYAVGFSPDGKTLASGSADQTIVLWDLSEPATPRQKATLTGHANLVTSVNFSPGGKILASGSTDNTIILWDVADLSMPHQLMTLTGHHNDVLSVVFSRDGKILASGGADNSIILWDVTDPPAPHQLATLTKHSGAVLSIAFSQNGQTMASGSADSMIILWDITDPTAPSQLTTLAGHSALVYRVAFNPDEETLASGSADSKIILWHYLDPAAPRQLATLSGHTDTVQSIKFNQDGQILASGSTDHAIILWDVSRPDRHHVLAYLTGHEKDVLSVAFRQDGMILASGGADNIVILWDVSDPTAPRQLSILTGHSDAIFSVAFSQDGKILASGSKDNSFILWDITDPALPRQLAVVMGHKGYVNSLVFSPNGKTLASGSADHTIILWNITNPTAPRQLATLTGQALEIYSVAFSPDGKTLASASADQTIILWDVTHLEAPRMLTSPLKGHSAPVFSIAFSPDGRTIASGSGDKTIILWDISDLTTPRQLAILTAPSDTGYRIAFSPDGKTLASVSADHTIILWDVNPQSLAEHACEVVGRNFTQAEWAEYFPGERYSITCPQWAEGR